MTSKIDLELMKKYDRSGPRYTSYPTAPHFSTDFSREELDAEQREAFKARSNDPLSLYFHIPFCRSLCLYCACHTQATSDEARIAAYADAVNSEVAQFASNHSVSRKVKQIHFGGGTPTHAGLPALARILDSASKRFSIDHDAEIAIELDPRQMTDSNLSDLRRLGFNRVSFGIQDLDPDVQRAVGRVQSPEQCERLVNEARRQGFASINLDLIYGLPLQTIESQHRTLDFVVQNLSPDRVAVFNFAFLPQLRSNQRAIDPAGLPNAETKLLLLKQAIEVFTSSGYDFIGLDHFAKPDDSLAVALSEGRLHRNFQGYTTLAEAEIIGFGASSISQYANIYSQNCKEEQQYLRRANEGRPPLERGIRLTTEDVMRRQIIMSLLCQGEVLKSKVESHFGISFDDHFAIALEPLQAFQNDGLLKMNGQKIAVTALGRLFVRNIAMAFDARLNENAAGGRVQTYSRTV